MRAAIHALGAAAPSVSARLPGRRPRRLPRLRAGRGFGKKKTEPEVEESPAPAPITSTSGRGEGNSAPLPAEDPSVPDEVVDRALTRMLTFSGVPFAAGLVFFPLFWYLKVVKHVDVPMWAVYMVSTVFVGVSLAGISYGLLSTSGTPSQKSFLGIDDFKRNVGIKKK